MNELDTSDLVRVERPIYVLRGLRIEPGGRDMPDRFVYRSGINQLGKLLGAELDIRFEHTVERFEKHHPGYRIHFATPSGLGDTNLFDGIVISIPAPQAHAILSASGESRSIEFVHYRSCLSVLMGFSELLETPPYHALIEPEQTHPLTWLSIESVKSPDRAPVGHTAMVAQLSPAYSRLHYESSDQIIISATLQYLTRLYGERFAKAEVTDVKRWRYSLPENIAMFGSVNPVGAKVVLAGDGLLGGRVEYAYETGILAADRMLEGK